MLRLVPRLLLSLPGLAGLLLMTPAQAQPENVDPTREALVAGTRVLGLAGAFVALAEGKEGLRHNAASPAVRRRDSFGHFDWSFGFDVQLPAVLPDSNLYNTAEDESAAPLSGFGLLSLGLVTQFGRTGFGLLAEGEHFESNNPSGLRLSGANFGVLTLLAAHGFADGQVLIGAGPRMAGFSFAGEDGGSLINSAAVGAEAGAIWRPHGERYRVGANFKSPITRDQAGLVDASDPASGWSPEGISMPWQTSIGAAYQFGPRTFNPRWRDPHEVVPESAVTEAPREAELSEGEREERLDRMRERVRLEAKEAYEKSPRSYFLVTGQLVLVGKSSNAASVDAVGSSSPQRLGDNLAVSPRLGVESEVVPRWLTLRAGSYGEPSRTSEATWRLHGTFGFDLRLFTWSVFGLLDEGTGWRFSAAGDAAREYLATSFSFGTWR